MPTEFAATVYDTLTGAGADLGLADAGYYAIEGLRLEKGYRAWGRELTPDYTPWQAGLGFAVRLDKGDFLGRDALVAAKAKPLTKRCVSLVAREADAPLAHGGELVLRDGRPVGEVTSAGFGDDPRPGGGARLCVVAGRRDRRWLARERPLRARYRRRARSRAGKPQGAVRSVIGAHAHVTETGWSAHGRREAEMPDRDLAAASIPDSRGACGRAAASAGVAFFRARLAGRTSGCRRAASDGAIDTTSDKTERYSITLSARARSVGGTVRPRALALLRLIRSSKAVGCSTGRSAGFAPLRILSMNTPARRYKLGTFGP